REKELLNFNDNLDTTNLNSDSEHKPDVRSSSLSCLRDTSNARLRSSYSFSVEFDN
ncbi:6837_t:CDS:1, partial [Funneliformis caledonium]